MKQMVSVPDVRRKMLHSQTYNKVKEIYFTERDVENGFGLNTACRQLQIVTDKGRFHIWLFSDDKNKLQIVDAEVEQDLERMAEDAEGQRKVEGRKTLRKSNECMQCD